ncbi:MAG: hypothetical protein AAF572_16205 [Cyanobacteria bacterium P01_B01_bin.77]
MNRDLLIAIAYFSTPAMLLYCVRKRRDTPFTQVFLLFNDDHQTPLAASMAHVFCPWVAWITQSVLPYRSYQS